MGRKIIRLLSGVLILLLLCSCGATYVSVVPHVEPQSDNPDSGVPVVNSALSLKNALLRMVEEGVEEGVLRAESYTGSLGTDLSQAVYEVSQNTPLGAYAVSNMTYDFSRIVSYYEIHIYTTYRRSLEEIRSIQSASDIDDLEGVLLTALERFDTRLVVRMSSFSAFEPEAMVEALCLSHPALIPEQPDTDMDLYPNQGAQRILEIRLNYAHTGEELQTMRQEAAAKADELVRRFGNSGFPGVDIQRLCTVTFQSVTLDDRSSSACDALLTGYADSRGLALACALLLEQDQIPCRVVPARRNGQTWYLCRAERNNSICYVDPAAAAEDTPLPLMSEDGLRSLGYELLPE